MTRKPNGLLALHTRWYTEVWIHGFYQPMDKALLLLQPIPFLFLTSYNNNNKCFQPVFKKKRINWLIFLPETSRLIWFLLHWFSLSRVELINSNFPSMFSMFWNVLLNVFDWFFEGKDFAWRHSTTRADTVLSLVQNPRIFERLILCRVPRGIFYYFSLHTAFV